jgi:hypothetical protein
MWWGRNEGTGDTRSIRISIAEGSLPPIDIWIDSFEPRHFQNHLIVTEGSDKENFLVFNTSKGKTKDRNAVGMK